MAEPSRRAATYEDILAAPEHLVAEILFGELVTHPRFWPRHAVTLTALSGILGQAFSLGKAGREAWIILYRPEVHLGPHVVVPDLAGWRQRRLRSFPDAAWIDIAPDWVGEVLSPTIEARARAEKRTIYAKARVPRLWHVDLLLRLLEVFELTDGKWLLLDVFRDDAEVAVPPFADAAFSLALLWPFDPPANEQA